MAGDVRLCNRVKKDQHAVRACPLAVAAALLPVVTIARPCHGKRLPVHGVDRGRVVVRLRSLYARNSGRDERLDRATNIEFNSVKAHAQRSHSSSVNTKNNSIIPPSTSTTVSLPSVST